MIGEEARSRFPIFEHTTYANSCSQGALSTDVREAYEVYLDGWDANGAEWEHWVERAEAARSTFARLVVEQNANVSLSIADRGYVLSTGRIVLEGKAKDLLEHEELRKAYLGR